MTVSLTKPPRPISFVWVADVLVHRGMTDLPLMLSYTSSANVAFGRSGFTDMDVETSCTNATHEALVRDLGPEDAAGADVLSVRWYPLI